MRTRVALIQFILLCIAFSASAQNLTRKQYIEKYKDVAIRQMHKHKIPASITLAQACLESGDGNSTLARKANNHFGIKCHNGWIGKKFRHDDDKKNECFRKYNDPIDSFTDHSYFLISGSRYNSLFDLPITDYKGWAHGLKAAGYATNPKYARLLIDIIEEYKLYKYDTGEAYKQLKSTSRQERKAAKIEKKRQRLERKAAKAAEKARKANFKYYEFTGETPQNTVKTLDEAVKAPQGTLPEPKDVHVVKKGDTLYSIARSNGVTLDELYRLNPGIKANGLAIGSQIKLR
ncbi:MAG: glucosaminidase domain-containing protein [Bacteroidales bacterium]|nr:glucosaminidase domain-containing protein [Bacteroidales bacterium]